MEQTQQNKPLIEQGSLVSRNKDIAKAPKTMKSTAKNQKESHPAQSSILGKRQNSSSQKITSPNKKIDTYQGLGSLEEMKEDGEDAQKPYFISCLLPRESQGDADLLQAADNTTFKTKTVALTGNEQNAVPALGLNARDKAQRRLILFNANNTEHPSLDNVSEYSFQFITEGAIKEYPVLADLLNVCYLIKYAQPISVKLSGTSGRMCKSLQLEPRASGNRDPIFDISNSQRSELISSQQTTTTNGGGRTHFFDYGMYVEIKGGEIAIKRAPGQVTQASTVYVRGYDNFLEELLKFMQIREYQIQMSGTEIKYIVQRKGRDVPLFDLFSQIVPSENILFAHDSNASAVTELYLFNNQDLLFMTANTSAHILEKKFTFLMMSTITKLFAGIGVQGNAIKSIKLLNADEKVKADSYISNFPRDLFCKFMNDIFELTICTIETNAEGTVGKIPHDIVSKFLNIKKSTPLHKKYFIADFCQDNPAIKSKFMQKMFGNREEGGQNLQFRHAHISATFALQYKMTAFQKAGCADFWVYDTAIWLYLSIVAKWLQQVILPHPDKVKNAHTVLCMYGKSGAGKTRYTKIIERGLAPFKWAQNKSFQNEDILDAQMILIQEANFGNKILETQPQYKELFDFEEKIKIDVKNKNMIEATQSVPIVITTNVNMLETVNDMEEQDKIAFMRRMVLVPFVQDMFSTVHKNVNSKFAHYTAAAEDTQNSTELFNSLIALACILPNGSATIFKQQKYADYFSKCVKDFLSTKFGKMIMRHSRQFNEIIEECYLHSTNDSSQYKDKELEGAYVTSISSLYDLVHRDEIQAIQGAQMGEKIKRYTCYLLNGQARINGYVPQGVALEPEFIRRQELSRLFEPYYDNDDQKKETIDFAQFKMMNLPSQTILREFFALTEEQLLLDSELVNTVHSTTDCVIMGGKKRTLEIPEFDDIPQKQEIEPSKLVVPPIFMSQYSAQRDEEVKQEKEASKYVAPLANPFRIEKQYRGHMGSIGDSIRAQPSIDAQASHLEEARSIPAKIGQFGQEIAYNVGNQDGTFDDCNFQVDQLFARPTPLQKESSVGKFSQ